MGCALRTLPLSCFPPRFHAISRLGNKVTFYTFTGIVWKRSQPHAYNDRNHRNRPWLSYQISDQKYKQYTAHDKQSWSPAKDKRGKNCWRRGKTKHNATLTWICGQQHLCNDWFMILLRSSYVSWKPTQICILRHATPVFHNGSLSHKECII